MYCTHCGNPIQDNAKFCTECGHPVEGTANEPTKQNTKTLPKGALVAAAIVAAIALGVFLATQVFGLSSHGTTTSSSAATTATTSETTSSHNQELSSAAASENPSSTPNAIDETNQAEDETTNITSAQSRVFQSASESGMQIFTGTVHASTIAQRAQERTPGTPGFETVDQECVCLDFDKPQEIFARNGDGYGCRTQKGDSIYLDQAVFKKYDGQHVTVAADGLQLWWPTDVSALLYSVGGDAVLLYVDGQAPVVASDAISSGNTYVLPLSCLSTYTRSELELLDNHTLFLARNEIYARHGRQFNNSELQQYFGSQNWYEPRIAPNDFNDDQFFSQAEKDNVKLMYEIEKERNSPYLG